MRLGEFLEELLSSRRPLRLLRPLRKKSSKQGRISPREFKILLQQKNLKIASLESLLEDKKREAIGFRAKVLRESIRSLQRQLEIVERKQDGI